MQILKTIILNGWPENINKVQEEIRSYFNGRDYIVVSNGLIYKGY